MQKGTLMDRNYAQINEGEFQSQNFQKYLKEELSSIERENIEYAMK